MAKLQVRRNEDSGNSREPVCPLHRDQIAKAACEKCGRFICEECRVDKGEHILCRECVDGPAEPIAEDGQPIVEPVDPTAAAAPASPPEGTPPPPPDAGGPACKNHPDRPPAAACTACKKFLCEECATSIDGQIICADCQGDGTIRTPEPMPVPDEIADEAPAAAGPPKLSVSPGDAAAESETADAAEEEFDDESAQPMSRRTRIAIGVGGCLALLLIGAGILFGLYIFLTAKGTQDSQNDSERQAQQKGTAAAGQPTAPDPNAAVTPPVPSGGDKSVFGLESPPKKRIRLEVAGTEYDCKIKDATVLTKEGNLLIATKYKPEGGNVGSIMLYIDAPVVQAGVSGKTLALNDAAIPGGAESVRVNVYFRPADDEAELKSVISSKAQYTSNPEDARNQTELIFGTLTLDQFSLEPGGPIAGQLEVQLLPTKLRDWDDEDVRMKLYWRFEGTLPGAE